MTLKKCNSRNGLRRFSELLCVAYVVAAAVNDGFSGVYLSLPFALYLLRNAWQRSRTVFALVMVCLLGAWGFSQLDRSGWSWFYPAVGQSFILPKEAPLFMSPYFPLQWSHFRLGNINDESKPDVVLPAGTRITLQRQYVNGHPDFGVNYLFQVSLNDSSLESLLVHRSLAFPMRGLSDEKQPLPKNALYMASYTVAALKDSNASASFRDISPRIEALTVLLLWPIWLPACVFLLVVWRFKLKDDAKALEK